MGKRKRGEDTAEKQITSIVHRLQALFGMPPVPTFLEDEELMQRFAQKLQLSPQICKPAAHISRKYYECALVDGRQKQSAVAAVSVFVVAWLLDVEEKPDLTAVANIAKVPTASLTNVYRKVRDHIRYLMPPDLACRKLP